MGDLLEIVRDKHHADATLRSVEDDAQHLMPRMRVELRRHLVKHKKARAHREHAGKRQALLLPTRESRDGTRPKVSKPTGVERRGHERTHLSLGKAEVEGAKGDLVKHDGSNELALGILPDPPDGPMKTQRVRGVPIKQHVPRLRHHATRQRRRKARLASAV